jgi:hypothetical protein
VLVVGAGPAGRRAAITLQRAGQRRLVVDKARFPRDKCCGDGLTTLALRELEALGFDPHDVDDWFDVDAAWLRSPVGSRGLPAAARTRALRRRRSPARNSTPRSSAVARRAGSTCATGTASRSLTRSRQTTSTSRRRRCGDRALPYVSPPTACGARCARRSERRSRATAASGMPFRQYAGNVTGPAAKHLIVWFGGADLLPGYSVVVPASR